MALEKRVDFRMALFLCPPKTASLTVHVELCTKSTVISKGPAATSISYEQVRTYEYIPSAHSVESG
jgi:hypothetical protein